MYDIEHTSVGFRMFRERNVLPLQQKVERVTEPYDFVLGRFVAKLEDFLPKVSKNLRGPLRRGERSEGFESTEGGVLYLKPRMEAYGGPWLCRASKLDRWIPDFSGPHELLHFPVERIEKAAKRLPKGFWKD